MNGVRFGVSAILVLTLGACSSARSDDASGASEDLLTTDDGFAEDVTVKEGRLELPLKGHEAVLNYEQGKILVGGPNSDIDSAKNPRGFLRRLESVHREGDTIVIETSHAALTDIFKGEVNLSNTTTLQSRANANGVAPQADWSGTYPQRINIPQTSLFNKHLTSGPINWDIDVGVNSGYLDFVPTISTSIDLSGASLKSVKLVANGKVEADVSLGLKVSASNPTSGESDTQTFEKVLYTAPRIRWSQLVGFVPVWESLEARLLIRCGVRVRATVQAGVGFHATSTLTAGGEYKSGEGFSGILEGPTFDFTPRWDAGVGGDVYAKCSLLPQVTLYAYDAAGPSLTVGPYVEGGLSRPVTLVGPTKWHADAGFSVDLGGRMEIFGHDIIDEHKNVLDKKFASYSGTLPF
jgi:hypothetical protein